MKAAVIGAGAWGTTLAKVLAENGAEVVIWSHDAGIANDINSFHENKLLLPDIRLPLSITSTVDLQKACGGAKVIVLVVASQFYSSMVSRLKEHLTSSVYIVSATKGFNKADNKRTSEVLFEMLPAEFGSGIAVLSGPNISMEIARQKPSATVISSQNNDTALYLQRQFNNDYFRVYTNNDVVGTELGGILKNIIAIAAGIIDGLDLGDNAKSAIMVRGMVEISRLAVKLGARQDTMFGLSGMGDLITTCSSTLSRNHFVGEHLGKGLKLNEILKKMTAIAEGVNTVKIIYPLLDELGVDMPVTTEVYKVLFEDKPVQEAINELMSRNAKSEQQ